MKTKAILFDLDGTAIDSPKQQLPSQRLIDAVKRLRSTYYICTATGRSKLACSDIIELLELNDLCIISGGTQIYDPNSGKIVWQKEIEPTSLVLLVEILKRNNLNKLILNDFTRAQYFEGMFYPSELDISQKAFLIIQRDIHVSLADKIVKDINSISGLISVAIKTTSNEHRDIHVGHKDATKEHGVSKLLRLLNITKESTIGIGDGYNDFHLFNAVNKKVAMQNAPDTLKELADLIIGHVKDDGLAEFLESL